jgi:hypothetical protein
MTEFLKSFSSLSLALSLFPLKQIENILTPPNYEGQDGPATKAMDGITKAVLDQFDGTLEATFSALDNLQRGTIAICARTMWHWQGYSGNRRTTETSRTDGGTQVEVASSLHNTPTSTGTRVHPMRPAMKQDLTAVTGRRL